MSFPRTALAITTLAAVMLSGCCFLRAGKLCSVLGSVEVSFTNALNGNAPVSMDILVVSSADVERRLLKLEADDWFSQKRWMLQQYGKHLQLVEEREWVPCTDPQILPFRYRGRARSVVVFVDYASPGEHRLVFGPRQPIELRFEEWAAVKTSFDDVPRKEVSPCPGHP